MYCEFYGLRERPFNVTSDPSFLYLNACYREALASLHYGVSQRKGFITLIGEAGTGKTTLLKKLLDDLDENTRTVFIFNTNVSFDEILEYIFHEFDLPVGNGRRLAMLQRLNAFLLEELRRGCNVALLIDEAQDLDFSVLEDLRLLSNLETAKEKILQIVLSGQPELAQKLANPGLRQLRQRVAINCRLMPLSKGELARYIGARLAAAGASDSSLFTPAAVERIYEVSRGIPRLVNVVCDNALVIGYAVGKRQIGADIINEAAADLHANDAYLETTPARPAPYSGRGLRRVKDSRAPASRRFFSQAPVVAGAVLVMLVGLLSAGRSWLRWDFSQAPRERAPRVPLEVVPPAANLGFAPPRSQAGTAGTGAEQFSPPVPVARQEALSRAEPGRRGPAGPWEPKEKKAAAPPPPAAVLPPPAAAAPPVVDVPQSEPGGLAGAGEKSSTSATASRPGPDTSPAVLASPAAPVSPTLREAATNPARELGDDRAASATSRMPAASEVRTDDSPVGEVVRVHRPQSPPAETGAPIRVASVSRQDMGADEPEMFDLDHLPGAPVRARPQAREQPRYVLSVPSYDEVVARPGDTLSRITARRYGQATTTLLDLVNLANPTIRDVDLIAVGQSIRLPRLDEGVALLRGSNGEHALLVYSSLDRGRAAQVRRVLAAAGFPARVEGGAFGAARTVYRVVVPGAQDRNAAVALGRRLRQFFEQDDRLAALAEAASD